MSNHNLINLQHYSTHATKAVDMHCQSNIKIVHLSAYVCT